LQPPEGLDVITNRQQLAVIHQRIGDLHLALADIDAAVGAYQLSLELDPVVPAGRMKLGNAYFRGSRLEEALKEFEQAVREMPNDSEIHLNLSEVHLSNGNFEQAAREAERAIELGASDQRALYLLGTALVRMGRRGPGEERLQEFARVEAG